MLTFVLPVFYTLLQVVTLVVVGVLIARTGQWSKAFFQSLSGLLVQVTLPLYFFTRLSQTDPESIRQSLIFPGVALLVTACSLAWAEVGFRVLAPTHPFKRVGIALSTFGNIGYLPLTLIELFPLTLPLLSERFGVAIPSLYVGAYLLVGSPLLWSLGNFLVTGKGRVPRLSEVFTPPMYGILAGLLVTLLGLQPIIFDKRLPFYMIIKALEQFGNVTVPLALIGLGAMIARMSIKNTNLRPLFSLTLIVSLVRFLMMPVFFFLCAWLLLSRLSLTPAQWWVIFLEIHIPPATNLAVMASQTGMNEDQVAFVILITYLAYLVLFPIYVTLFLALPGILA